MRYLGEVLSRRGFRSVGLVLPGHTTSPKELDKTTWFDWFTGVEAAFDRLRAECEQVAVVGQSLGGLLALRLAQQRGHDIAATATLATPISLPPLARFAIGATRAGSPLRWVIRNLPKFNGSDVCDPVAKKSNPGYRVIPLRALHQLVEFMQLVASDLDRVRSPTLVVHSTQDHTAPYASSEAIISGIAAEVKVHRTLERSYHLIAMDVERDLVAAEVGDFFAAQFAGSN